MEPISTQLNVLKAEIDSLDSLIYLKKSSFAALAEEWVSGSQMATEASPQMLSLEIPVKAAPTTNKTFADPKSLPIQTQVYKFARNHRSAATIAEVKRLYLAGEALSVIAQKTGVPAGGSMYQYLVDEQGNPLRRVKQQHRYPVRISADALLPAPVVPVKAPRGQDKQPRKVRKARFFVDTAEVVRLYATGLNQRQVAQKMNISFQVVSRQLQKAGVETRPSYFGKGSPPPASLLAYFYSGGMSLAEVGQQVHRSQSTVHRILVDAGVQLRPAGGVKKAGR